MSALKSLQCGDWGSRLSSRQKEKLGSVHDRLDKTYKRCLGHIQRLGQLAFKNKQAKAECGESFMLGSTFCSTNLLNL